MWLQPSSAAIRRTPQPSALRRTIAATSSGALILSPCASTPRREISLLDPTIEPSASEGPVPRVVTSPDSHVVQQGDLLPLAAGVRRAQERPGQAPEGAG